MGAGGWEEARMKIKIPVTVRRGISKRSHEKIGDCEQSTKDASNNEVTFVTPGADILIGSSHTLTFFCDSHSEKTGTSSKRQCEC